LLLKVWKQLAANNVALHLIGPVSKETIAIIQKEAPDVSIKGKLPFAELKKTLQEYDVMVFPSFLKVSGWLFWKLCQQDYPLLPPQQQPALILSVTGRVG